MTEKFQAPEGAADAPDLPKAAQAVLDRWNSPKWEWSKQGPTADLMAGLRAALAAQHGAAPVAWCQLALDGRHIAYFDGKPMVMPGPVGNDCHPHPLYVGGAPAQCAAEGDERDPNSIFQTDGLPERDPAKPAEQQGLFRKFVVTRTDGSDKPGGKHENCEYFVLDVGHDKHALAALWAYAQACKDTHPDLAADLIERYELAQSDVQPKGTAGDDMTDEQVDRILSASIPGGSAAGDWFLPHEQAKGLANVRDVVRRMAAEVSNITGNPYLGNQALEEAWSDNEELRSKLEEARQEPWPEWADNILKVVRQCSGYDGFDDASEGVDLPEEVRECLEALAQEAKPMAAIGPAAVRAGYRGDMPVAEFVCARLQAPAVGAEPVGDASDGHETSPSELLRLAMKLELRSGVIGDGRAEAAIHMRRAAATLATAENSVSVYMAERNQARDRVRQLRSELDAHTPVMTAAAEAIESLLSLIRRNAPELSGKVIGWAERDLAALRAIVGSKPPVQPTGGANG